VLVIESKNTFMRKTFTWRQDHVTIRYDTIVGV